MHRQIRNVAVLLLAAYPIVARAADNGYLANLPTGDRWLMHLNTDLLPFWTMPSALGSPLGSFPSTRCDDGSLLDFNNPCAPIAGNAYLMTPDQYLVPLSRQTYGYGVAYQLTGNTVYLDYMKAGVAYIRQYCIDPAGGMFEQLDLTTGLWGPNILYRDPQQLGYGLLGMAFYYYLTRDDTVLQDILTIKNYIFASYYNPSLGANQWLLANDNGTLADSKQLVADLDEMNTYLVLLTPTLSEPYQTQWKQTLTMDAQSILGTYYSPEDNLFFLQADTPQEMDINYTGVDVGHSSKALWMLRWTGLLTGDQGLASFAQANARRLLDRAYMPESDGSGSWAQGVLQGGAQDQDKTWWVYAELDQLSGTLALSDVAAGQYLPQTAAYWFNYFVDHQYGEVWNGLNYPANTPQKSYPKAWQWKNAYHDFEHTLVGYITSQWLLGQPVTLHYAFTNPVDQTTIHPTISPARSTLSLPPRTARATHTRQSHSTPSTWDRRRRWWQLPPPASSPVRLPRDRSLPCGVRACWPAPSRLPTPTAYPAWRKSSTPRQLRSTSRYHPAPRPVWQPSRSRLWTEYPHQHPPPPR